RSQRFDVHLRLAPTVTRAEPAIGLWLEDDGGRASHPVSGVSFSSRRVADHAGLELPRPARSAARESLRCVATGISFPTVSPAPRASLPGSCAARASARFHRRERYGRVSGARSPPWLPQPTPRAAGPCGCPKAGATTEGC